MNAECDVEVIIWLYEGRMRDSPTTARAVMFSMIKLIVQVKCGKSRIA